ncbi:MAG: YggT family protein [Rhizobiaceae bacterium]|jgi:YggT family protein|nr:YggT family protein [Rhizobiaceae bacterium]
MTAVITTLVAILDFYWWIVVISAIFSWLYAFNVINSSNQFVNQIGSFLYAITEPVYRPIRRFLPNLGGIDISPIIVLFALLFLRTLILTSLAPALVG